MFVSYLRYIVLKIFSGKLFPLLIITLNYLLIPRYGIVGAGISTVITDLIISFGMDMKRKRFKELLSLKIEAVFFIASAKS